MCHCHEMGSQFNANSVLNLSTQAVDYLIHWATKMGGEDFSKTILAHGRSRGLPGDEAFERSARRAGLLPTSGKCYIRFKTLVAVVGILSPNLTEDQIQEKAERTLIELRKLSADKPLEVGVPISDGSRNPMGASSSPTLRIPSPWRYFKLTKEYHKTWSLVMKSLENTTDLSLLIYGPPGSGKTQAALRIYSDFSDQLGDAYYLDLISYKDLEHKPIEIQAQLVIETVNMAERSRKLVGSLNPTALIVLDNVPNDLVAKLHDRKQELLRETEISAHIFISGLPRSPGMKSVGIKHLDKEAAIDLIQDLLSEVLIHDNNNQEFFQKIIQSSECPSQDTMRNMH